VPVPDLASKLIPEPRRLTLDEGHFALGGKPVSVTVPSGPEHEACREVLRATLRIAGATAPGGAREAQGNSFTLGEGAPLPALPAEGVAEQG